MTLAEPQNTSATAPARANQPVFLFDLDRTLVDSVYQHVVAWREALEGVGINLSMWRIHRRIGMSGGLFVNALARELATDLDRDPLAALPTLHADAYVRHFDTVRALPGAVELLATLSEHGVPWAIATSGAERYARLALELLELPQDTPLITRDQVRYAKPDPDLFLTAAERTEVDIRGSIVVGDSVWDLLAARRDASREHHTNRMTRSHPAESEHHGMFAPASPLGSTVRFCFRPASGGS